MDEWIDDGEVEIVRQMGNLRFTPDRNDFTHRRGFWLRALEQLHVSFDPIRS